MKDSVRLHLRIRRKVKFMFFKIGQYEVSIDNGLFTFTDEERVVSLARLNDGFALKVGRYQVCVSNSNKTPKSGSGI